MATANRQKKRANNQNRGFSTAMTEAKEGLERSRQERKATTYYPMKGQQEDDDEENIPKETPISREFLLSLFPS